MSRIILHTELNAENNAMLQALYSRSIDSVTDHLEKLQATGSSKFMSSYYLGYGHASIGDCGTETLYFEGVSMLAAKALEDNPLFVGQECSSRYIDFSNQPFHDPAPKNSELSGKIGNLYAHYRDFYVSSLEPLKAALRVRFPIQDDDKAGVYEKAIMARAFDILRGFLPASATTNVAWTARLSNGGEHLIWMMHHPLKEVRELGVQAYKKMREKYPSSFHASYAAIDEEQIEAGLRFIEGDELYEFNSDFSNFYAKFHDVMDYNLVAKQVEIQTAVQLEEGVEELLEMFPSYKTRPKKTKLHKHALSSHASVVMAATMDFGSFRDIQRHRNGYCSMPLITGEYGVHPWYYENLTDELRLEADKLLLAVKNTYVSMSFDDELSEEDSTNKFLVDNQYLLPMGNIVEVALRYSVQQAVYVAELRSGKTVHATVRPFAQALASELEFYGIPMFNDKDERSWTVKRGEQDIVQK